jgi:hypothetical protein
MWKPHRDSIVAMHRDEPHYGRCASAARPVDRSHVRFFREHAFYRLGGTNGVPSPAHTAFQGAEDEGFLDDVVQARKRKRPCARRDSSQPCTVGLPGTVVRMGDGHAPAPGRSSCLFPSDRMLTLLLRISGNSANRVLPMDLAIQAVQDCPRRVGPRTAEAAPRKRAHEAGTRFTTVTRRLRRAGRPQVRASASRSYAVVT